MGVDALIYFRIEGDVPLMDLAGFHAEEFKDYYFKIEHPVIFDPTHIVDPGQRWYSETYDRGYWHVTCSILMELMAMKEVVRVWYKSDVDDPVNSDEPITINRILELSKYYMENKHASV